MSFVIGDPDVSLNELICCPQCRGPIEAGTDCSNCGAPCRIDGPVVNFLGPEAYVLSDRSDVAKASWLIEHRHDWDDINLDTGSEEYSRLADSDVSSAALVRIVRGTTFRQIMNDLRGICDGIAASSTTIEFMLDRSTIGSDSVVLDVGCSAGRHLWELRGRSPRFLAGVDIQLFPLAVGALSWQAQANSLRPRLCCASALSLPFKNQSFTNVNCFVMLSVVPIYAALAELHRVLAPEGQLMVTIEGMGFWQRRWNEAPLFSMNRINLVRTWLGERLLRYGFDWQRHPLLRRLSGHNPFTHQTIEQVMSRAGFVINECQVLNDYQGHPLLFGVTLRKRET